jgi:flagellar hook-associated protein 3 FlgL
MLGSLMLLVTALENNDRELAERLIGSMDLAMDELLSARATVGSRTIRLETTQTRLEQTQITITRLLSEVEDADIVSAVSELAREENLYQAALMASSRIMRQSLIDFLR